jgi:hypothetical protein
VPNDAEPFSFVERKSRVYLEEAKVDRQPRGFRLPNQAVDQSGTDTPTVKLRQKVYLAQDQARGFPKDKPDPDIHSIDRDDIRPIRGEFVGMTLTLPFLVPLAKGLLRIGPHRSLCHKEAEFVITVLRWPERYCSLHRIALQWGGGFAASGGTKGLAGRQNAAAAAEKGKGRGAPC